MSNFSNDSAMHDDTTIDTATIEGRMRELQSIAKQKLLKGGVATGSAKGDTATWEVKNWGNFHDHDFNNH